MTGPTLTAAFAARFWARVDRSADCWVWTRGKTGGYGAVAPPGAGTNVGAHRVAFALAYGWWPAGMDVHHLCGRPDCVNPDHLVACTRAQHMALHPRPEPPPRAPREACRRGHPLDGANAYVAADGARRCRACKNAATRRWHGGRLTAPPLGCEAGAP